jgi:adenine-specific DNA methylase
LNLIERDFPIEYLNALVERESSANFMRKPIYNMHKWWARRVASTFRVITLLTFLREFKDVGAARPNEVDGSTKFKEWFWGVVENGKLVKRGVFYESIDLSKTLGFSPIVLDPFMGGGTPVVEALRLGCKVIGVDINPVAWFVTKKEAEQVDLDRLDRVFQELERKLADKIKHYYKTVCPKCLEETHRQENSKADFIYAFWVKKLPCITCGEEVKLFRSFVLGHPKGKEPIVFCPNCGYIFEARAEDLEETCAKCGSTFIPNRGSASPLDEEIGKRRNGMYRCSKGHLHKILDATRRLLHKRMKEGIWYPEEAELYAIEYYCPKHKRNYKMADEYDKALYNEAKIALYKRIEDFKERGIDIFGTLIPAQEKPSAFSDRINAYGYRYFWQLFNERQLLCLSLLLEEILKLSDLKVKEYLLMIFSDILNYNNFFCAYDVKQQVITDLFSRHAYQYRVSPVENNVWGVEDEKGEIIGRGSFKGYFLKGRKGLEFQRDPFERYLVKDGTKRIKVRGIIDGRFAESFEDLLLKDSNVLLRAMDSQDLSFIPDNKVDAVITDPPYYDNVMYGELADFYYVWLRLGLKDYYDEFKPLYVPKSAEIVVNPKAGKNHEDYIRMLSSVFKECYRVLKDDGLMVLTYHHKKPETWAAILEAILNAGFHIVATYPIYSEMKVSTHIRAKGAREFDTIIVARKKRLDNNTQPTSWDKLKDEIYLKAREMVERVKVSHPSLSNGDVATIVLGKCLEVYSTYYPNVTSEDGRVDISQAFKDIRDIITDLQSAEVIPKSDRITELYLRHLAKRNTIDYNELLKIVQSSEFGVSIERLKDLNLVTQRGDTLVVVDPLRRGKWLSDGLNLKRKRLDYYIDAIHYLYAQFREGRRLPHLSELGEFDETIVISTLSYMARELKDETYKKILDLLKLAEKERRGLEKWFM